MTRAPDRATPAAATSGAARLGDPARRGVVAREHLRVVVFSDAIPGRNGVGTFYDDLADGLAEHLGTIRVVAPPPVDSAEHRGWSIPMPGDPTQRMRIPWAPQIWRQVRWMKPHVVLAATPGIYGVVGLLLAWRLRTGGALCYHTEIPKLAETYWKGPLTRLAGAALDVWDRFLVRRSPAVLAPNAELVETLAKLGRADAHLMATPAPKRFVETEPPGFPDRIERVAFVGRLAAEKRIRTFLEAARAHPGLRFDVLGDGPLREEVEAAAAELDNVSYTSWVDRERVMAFLDGTDLVVLPSRHETFGSVAFEAMARGRLALVSPECGITQWPTLAPGLLVMEPGETVTAAIGRLQALEPETLARIGSAARRAALELHEEAIEDWLGLLGRLARA